MMTHTHTPSIPTLSSPAKSLCVAQQILMFRHKAPACCRFLDSGGVYKLAFGPKAFIVVSDPVVVRHLLKVKSLHRPGVCRICNYASPLHSTPSVSSVTSCWWGTAMGRGGLMGSYWGPALGVGGIQHCPASLQLCLAKQARIGCMLRNHPAVDPRAALLFTLSIPVTDAQCGQHTECIA